MNEIVHSPRARRLLVVLIAIAAVVTMQVAVTAARPGEHRPQAEQPRQALATRPLPPAAPEMAAPRDASSRNWRAVARERLHVLRQPRSVTADAVAPAIAGQPTVADGDIDLTAARRVKAADGEAAWIAPSADGDAICGVRAGAVACPATALLEVTGLSPAINGRLGEPYHVWGIAGDDVSSLVLIEGDGTRVSVTVTDNFFDVETDDWPRSLTWTGPNGPESFTYPPRP